MAADVLGEAVVELAADVDKFGSDYNKALKGLEKDAQKAADDVDKAFKSMSGNLGKEFEKAAKEIEKEFKRQERAAEAHARRMELQAARSAALIEREQIRVQRDIEKETARVARENERVQREYEKSFIASQKAMQDAVEETQRIERERLRDRVNAVRKFASEKFSLTLGIDFRQITSAVAAVSKLGAVLGAVGVGALAGQASIAGIGALVVAINQLVGAVALIPAAGVAAATVIGTLKIGMKGLGDAISAEKPEEFAEALKKLSENGGKFAKAVRDMKDEWEDLGKAVQQELFAGLDKEFTRLANILIPKLQTGFKGVAKELNLAAKALAGFARDKQTLQDVDKIFFNTSQSVMVFRRSLVPAAEAFRDIVAVGSEFLPVIAAELGGVVNEFADFIAQARESGQLQDFFENALNAVRDLFGFLANVGGIFNAISNAAEAALGGGFLSIINNATQKVQDFLESAEGQTALIQFFEGAQEAANALTAPLLQLAQAVLEVVLPALTKLGTIAAPPLDALIRGLRDGIETALPGIFKLVEALGDVVEVLVSAGVLDSLGELVNVLGTSLGKALQDLAPALARLVNEVLSTLVRILPKILPSLEKFATAFADLVIAALPLVDVLAEIVSTVGLPTLQRVAEKLAPIIEDLASSFSDVLLPVLPDLADAFLELVDALAPIVDDILVLFIDLLKILVPLLPSIIRSITELAKAVAPFLQTILDIVDPLTKFIQKLFEIPGATQFLKEDLPTILALLSGTLIVPIGKILELLGQLYDKLEEAGVFDAIINGLTILGLTFEGAKSIIETFRTAWDLTWEWIKRITSVSVDFVSTLVINGFTGIGNFLTTIWEWIKSIVSTAWSFITNLVSTGARTLLAIITGNFGAIPNVVRDALGRMRDAASDAFNRLLDFVGSIPSRILSALGNLGNLLYQAGRDVVNGMINGITSAVGSLANTAANMAKNALNAAKAAIGSNSPSKAMMVVGEDFGKGFVIGIDSMLRKVTDAGADIASQTVQAAKQSLAPSDNAAFQLTQTLNRLTANGYGPPTPAPVTNAPQTPSDTPVVVTPEVYVYIGDKEINDHITEVVDDRDRRTKRSITMGARRLV